MSIERTMVCDNCGGIIAADFSVAAVRRVASQQCKAKRINGMDYCADCQQRGFPKTSSAT